ncbi:uncharacterized protein F4822DRAFT_418989 [Hypoxylon trugodes]|uniref:uncharacterized protein n=1 Tax=Hypoxylon trugodes TaxID=326681 RepID=UPI0021914986|nr:uncharacterized protein F4822DRAFT_418989 [Hypoxylon trugodes]KAI1384203.1 hypothetical protein F4822DRAFT_418989 [Hypoxylon trugodes]
MPVTTRPSPSKMGKNKDYETAFHADARTVFDIVTNDCHSPYEKDPRWPQPIPRSSWYVDDTGFRGFKVLASSTLRRLLRVPYLVIRPDDVWQASVTLLGTRQDWELLASRVDRLHKYGEECEHWATLLRPVMRYMLKTFDEPDSQEVKNFWLRVAYEAGIEGSIPGIRTVSGWITAFAYFDGEGKAARDYKEDYIRQIYEKMSDSPPERKRLILDGVLYPLIRFSEIPRGIVLLPITIDDLEAGVKRFATAVSGTIGMSISENGTTSQPFSAWWVVQEFKEPLRSPVAVKAGDSVKDLTTKRTSNTFLDSWISWIVGSGSGSRRRNSSMSKAELTVDCLRGFLRGVAGIPPSESP